MELTKEQVLDSGKNLPEAQRRFWGNWLYRFNQSKYDFITPYNTKVKKFIKRQSITKRTNKDSIRDTLWEAVYRNTEYELSKVWKTPSETLEDGKGDCEDMTFLIASCLTFLDQKSRIQLGYLVKEDKEHPIPHVWNMYNGKVIDCTGPKKDLKNNKYATEYDIRIIPNDTDKPVIHGIGFQIPNNQGNGRFTRMVVGTVVGALMSQIVG